MKIIKPYYEILSKVDGKELLKNIERAGRTCYKSEDKITDESAEKFIRMLVERGHESVLEHEKISVLFVCDRGVSHEIVRHRLASFSQESTRYCNYSTSKFLDGMTFILPCWIPEDDKNEEYRAWLARMSYAESSYGTLMQKFQWTPQQARCILPNSLKTEIVVTANIREWRTIFKQRTAKAAHPQMRELMCPLLDELKNIIPVVFSDITY